MSANASLQENLVKLRNLTAALANFGGSQMSSAILETAHILWSLFGCLLSFCLIHSY